MERPKLVVLGSGFAGFSFLKRIDTELYDVSIVSPRNHFLFTPLLPSTTVGTIEFRSIIEPVRHAGKNITYFQASCAAIDINNRIAECTSVPGSVSFKLPYATLVIAVGGVNNTYGIPGVEQHALFLKDAADARAIRRAIIDCLERASTPSLTREERLRLLHFVVVGGGPTGVEFSAEMHDFLVDDLCGAFPGVADDVRITLLEASDHILNSFDEELSAYTQRYFRRQRIEVRTGSPVTCVTENKVFLKDGGEIPYGLLVWSTGIGATSLVKSLQLKQDSFSRLIVNDFLQIEGLAGIYALGDCAAVVGMDLPATAQVAQQQGNYLGRSLSRLAKGKAARRFEYKNLGMLAYVGGRRALADMSSFKGHGFVAWMFWRSAYLTRLVSFKNKVLVIFDWIKTLVFGRDVSRF